MRRRRSPIRPFQGQLIFAHLDGGSITLDCLLSTRTCGKESVPVTLTAKLPPSWEREPAVGLLQRWAEELLLIDIRISEGRTGPEVELSTGAGRVVLEAIHEGDWD